MASAARRFAVLPSARAPVIATTSSFGAAGMPQALLAMLPLSAAPRSLARLPEAARWRALHARSAPCAASVRSTVLGNREQTLAVLGYLAADASPFERLTLAARMLKEAAARSPASIGLAAPGGGTSARGALEALLAAALSFAFPLPSYRSAARDAHPLRRLTLLDGAGLDLRYAAAVARGTNLARWLTALPPNILDARSYRRALARLARTHGLRMRWLDERALRAAGAGAFLAVARGNAERGAGIAHLRYRPRRRRGRDRPDIALVGKGILFDTGGVNLKTHRSMLDMHTDMSGSAVALATLLALAELDAPLAVDAWLAITANQIGPRAYQPQEIVTAANGVTIQVIHTDAEGRMVLADTLSLAGRTRPRFIIDFATLTGACVYSLTERMSGVFSNRPQLAARLSEAGRVSGERVWNFPNEPDYDADLESKVADIQQCAPEGKGDHILATRFLSRFVPRECAWVHVDLSAATRSGGLAHVGTDVTGFGVRFALELILGQNVLGALEGAR